MRGPRAAASMRSSNRLHSEGRALQERPASRRCSGCEAQGQADGWRSPIGCHECTPALKAAKQGCCPGAWAMKPRGGVVWRPAVLGSECPICDHCW